MRIQDLKGARGGEVTLATMNGLAGLIRRSSPAFGEAHPSGPGVGARPVRRRHHQCGADRRSGPWAGLQYCGLRRASRRAPSIARGWAIVTADHPPALRPRALADCLEYPVVLGDQSMTIYGLVMSAFAQADLPFSPSYQSNSIDCMEGDGEGYKYELCDLPQPHRRGRRATAWLAGLCDDPRQILSAQTLRWSAAAKAYSTSPSIFWKKPSRPS